MVDQKIKLFNNSDGKLFTHQRVGLCARGLIVVSSRLDHVDGTNVLRVCGS